MKTVKSIAFIGGTGKLAVPVVNLLAKNGYTVTAIVRDINKARKVLDSEVRLIEGNLKEPTSIMTGLHGMDAVYINLATETDRLDLPFYEEREGVRTIVEAARKNGLVHIYKIGAGGAYPDNVGSTSYQAVPNMIRLAGNRFIEESGIPYTFFDPTMFMDNIPLQIKGNVIQWLGNAPVKNYWISTIDYARQVSMRINNARASTNRHYLMQGPGIIDPAGSLCSI